MLMSGLFGEDLFDDFWGYPTRELANIDKQLYGKHAQYLMKTDVHENEEDYEMDRSILRMVTLPSVPLRSTTVRKRSMARSFVRKDTLDPCRGASMSVKV